MAQKTAAPRYRWIIGQGETETLTAVWKDENGDPYPLDGYTAELKLALAKGGTPILDYSTSSGEIVITAAAGKVTVTVPAATTAGLSFTEAFFDLSVTSPGGVKTRLLQGPVVLDKEV